MDEYEKSIPRDYDVTSDSVASKLLKKYGDSTIVRRIEDVIYAATRETIKVDYGVVCRERENKQPTRYAYCNHVG